MALARMKVPLLLNFSQCKLLQKDYYRVIELSTEVLTYDPDNLKALFRRGKAHVGSWDPEKAEEDFNRCVELDPALKTTVDKEIVLLKATIKSLAEKEKSNFKKMF